MKNQEKPVPAPAPPPPASKPVKKKPGRKAKATGASTPAAAEEPAKPAPPAAPGDAPLPPAEAVAGRLRLAASGEPTRGARVPARTLAREAERGQSQGLRALAQALERFFDLRDGGFDLGQPRADLVEHLERRAVDEVLVARACP